MMDAGVPISHPVAGISVGLFSCKESGRHKLVTDIIVGYIVSKSFCVSDPVSCRVWKITLAKWWVVAFLFLSL